MKIKELHIRNIASIEKADIDFEKDLIDGDTGLPASMFLISGDTGAGKSIILDGIAMALYGTTPRMESVAGKKNNEFKNADGQSVKVYAIEQYTRLGISEKDDSYSEVVFEGNDGMEYHARFTLGLYLARKKDPVTGKRPLSYNEPTLSVTVGDETLTKKDAERRIEKAVGLSFDQFSRMAMLAQGQFATFLTGDKKERESILEQLTNTEQFSRYGEAIKSLYDKSKSALSVAQVAFNTEKAHTMPQEEVDALKGRSGELKKDKDENDARIQENGRRLDNIKIIEKAESEILAAEKEKRKQDETQKGEAYAKAKALVSDWEDTSTERQRLVDRRAAEEKLGTAKERAQILANKYQTLAADLAFRKKETAGRKSALDKQASWLDERQDRKDLYAHSAGVLEKMKNYGAILADITTIAGNQQAVTEKTQGLVAAAKKKKTLAGEANAALESKQAEIDALTEKRNALEPQRTNDALGEVGSVITALGLLKNSLGKFATDKKACDDLRKKVKDDEKTLESLAKAFTDADTVYEAAKRAKDLAQSCYTTMSSSLDDMLVDLRKQLVDNKETVCPLCGQRIEKISDDYQGRLSELDIKRTEANQFFTDAEKKRNDANNELKTFSGELGQKKRELEAKESALKNSKVAIEKQAEDAGLEAGEGLAGRIEDALKELKEREGQLKDVQRQAVVIQEQIDGLLTEKNTLQSAFNEAKSVSDGAAQDVVDNATMIASLKNMMGGKENDRQMLHAEISKELFAFYPKWEEDLLSVQQQLKDDSKEYLDCQEAVRVETMALQKSGGVLDTIEGFNTDILGLYPEWDSEVIPAEYRADNIMAEWQSLFGDAKTLHTNVETCKNTVKDCSTVLDTWYGKTGRDEKALDDIIRSANQLTAARNLVKQADEALKSATDAIERATRSRNDAMEALAAKTSEDLPKKADLESEKTSLAATNDSLVGQIAEIEGKLKENSANVDALEKKRNELEKASAMFEKWNIMNRYFGGSRFQTLVQTYILRPLLNNANIYLERVTDRYKLTCSEENEQLSILVHDRYNKDQIRSVTVLSGGERFMISLALSLALSSLNRPDMNVNILFIDEGFGTLDTTTLESVMATLERLQEIAGESNRRVGIISHREELDARVPTQIKVVKKGEGRSHVEIKQA